MFNKPNYRFSMSRYRTVISSEENLFWIHSTKSLQDLKLTPSIPDQRADCFGHIFVEPTYMTKGHATKGLMRFCLVGKTPWQLPHIRGWKPCLLSKTSHDSMPSKGKYQSSKKFYIKFSLGFRLEPGKDILKKILKKKIQNRIVQ